MSVTHWITVESSVEPYPALHPSEYAVQRPSETPEVHQLSASVQPEAGRRSVSYSQSVAPGPSRNRGNPLFRAPSSTATPSAYAGSDDEEVVGEDDLRAFRESTEAYADRFGEEEGQEEDDLPL